MKLNIKNFKYEQVIRLNFSKIEKKKYFKKYFKKSFFM